VGAVLVAGFGAIAAYRSKPTPARVT